MSNKISDRVLTKHRDNFIEIWKKVQRYITARPLTKDQNKLQGYRTDIVATYNKLLEYIVDFYTNESTTKQVELKELVIANRERIEISFKVLKLEYDFTKANLFAQINTSEIKLIEETSKDTATPDTGATAGGSSTQDTTSTATEAEKIASAASELVEPDGSPDNNDNLEDIDNDNFENIEIQTEEEESNVSDSEGIQQLFVPANANNTANNTANNIQLPNRSIMAKALYLKSASAIINYKYAGDPLKLESFLTDISLIEDLIENDAIRPTCVLFIKSRMEAKALECLPEDANTVQQIVEALRASIKPESSQVIEGKIMALRLEKGDFTKFSESAEKLAEAFRRSLVIEGISKAKAQEMTVKKTVDLCRKIARNDVVKSVLSAATFEKPEEVIAKFVTEVDTAKKERRDAENFQNRKQLNPNNRKPFNNRDNRDSRRGGRPGQQFNQNRNRGFRQNDNRAQNNRGHGNGRGNGRDFRQNNRGNHNNRPVEHTIRVVSGNGQNPPPVGNVQQPEQVFHIPMN